MSCNIIQVSEVTREVSIIIPVYAYCILKCIPNRVLSLYSTVQYHYKYSTVFKKFILKMINTGTVPVQYHTNTVQVQVYI